MSDYTSMYDQSVVVAQASPEIRQGFLRRTMYHLAGGLAIFAGLCGLLTMSPIGMMLAGLFFTTTLGILVFFALFVGFSYLASRWAYSSTNLTLQYAGYGLYIVLQSILFTPLLLAVMTLTNSGQILLQSGIMTAVLVISLIGLTVINKLDFGFLNGFLFIASVLIFGIIIVSLFTPLNLGVWFSAAMIGFASLAILRDTSDVMYRFNSHQHVAAALALFASIALLLFYVIRFFYQINRN